MTSLVSQEPSLATIPESPTSEANHTFLSRGTKSRHLITMPQYNQGAGPYQGSNGYPDQQPSPNNSHHSIDGHDATLISRTQKQHTTQQVTTTTKTIREIQYLGPDGQLLDYLPNMAAHPTAAPRSLKNTLPQNYEQIDYEDQIYQGEPSHFQDYDRYGGNYAEYPHKPPTPPSPSDRSASPPPQHREPDYLRHRSGMGSTSGYPPPRSGYDELDTTLMPPRGGGEYGRASPGPLHPAGITSIFQGDDGYIPRYSSVDDPQFNLHGNLGYDPNLDNSVFEVAPPLVGAPRAIFDEDENQREPSPEHRMQQRGIPGVQWRDPNLHEVIEFLNNPNNVIKANAAAYLQHLCYLDDPVKAKTRQLGGIPPLVNLLGSEIPEIHRNACGVLRNLSYGRQNDENKRAIKNAGGVTALVRLLRKTSDNQVKELVSGVLWNLSSCEDLKKSIIEEALLILVNLVIIPHSGWDPNGSYGDTQWTTVFRNGSGILRNVSSAGDYGRKQLRECDGLVDSLLYLVKKAIEKNNIDNKSVENCVCVLRNLSYRAQEVEDPNYDKKHLPVTETRANAKMTSDNLGCFNSSKAKRKDSLGGSPKENVNISRRIATGKGMELLWQPEVVQPYLSLLSNSSNPETLEGAAGAIQNLSACYWQPSIDIRAAVRKEKGLPILVELLRMEIDRVVCAVATALRNLAIDQRNKELIGKYAMRDLVQKLPSGNFDRERGTSDDTIAAVLATLNEVIKKHPEFSRSLLEAGGVDRLMTINRYRQRFSSRVLKFAGQVLYSMWQHQELREVYRKAGWNQSDFVSKTVAARNARPNSPTNLNSTLNRPMASQSGTRYEDRTMQRPGAMAGGPGENYRPDDIQMQNMSLYGTTAQQPGNHVVYPGEPVYAQVNREKKKNSRNQMDPNFAGGYNHDQGYHPHSGNYAEHGELWDPNTATQRPGGPQLNPDNGAGGDSWV